MKYEMLMIINLGGQNNQMLARKVRDKHVYCEVAPYGITAKEIKEIKPKGIIFSVTNIEESKKDYKTIIEEIEALEIPTLYIESMTRDQDKDILTTFLFDTCKCQKEWKMEDFANKSIKQLKDKLKGKKVLCALSGGVDSSVAAVLIHRAIGKDLTCIFVDHGLLRKNEGDEVEKIFGEEFDMNLIRVNVQDQFLSKLEGVSDPEKKRMIIGEEFIRVFEAEAKKIGKVDFLVQGTIYPDIIESGTKEELAVKSHHNVGGLPDHVDFKEIIEPLSTLFKDEVRDVGRAIGIPEFLVARQPFPGPGLAIRIIGDITKDKLDILREADYIYREEVAKAGLDKEIWQYFAVLTDLKTVGVIDNKRTYQYTLALRGVTSIDGMSADWARIPHDVLAKMSNRITSEVDGINRIVYDITGKPPATIEWE